jgi:hypothetical protein
MMQVQRFTESVQLCILRELKCNLWSRALPRLLFDLHFRAINGGEVPCLLLVVEGCLKYGGTWLVEFIRGAWHSLLAYCHFLFILCYRLVNYNISWFGLVPLLF